MGRGGDRSEGGPSAGDAGSPPDPGALEPPYVRGRLRISRFAASDEEASEPVRHRTAFVPDDVYDGMADNDVRGFLDGGFVYAWNQESQQQVRAGRLPWHRPAPPYGEPELFRCLHRWSDLDLPRGADVVRARLSLTVERTPDRPVTVLLYRVDRDWGPGEGGELRDNTSPPAEGEVWWRAAAEGERGWALPGAGFCSEDRDDTDLALMPLAAAACSPGDATLSFASSRLTAYVDRRVRDGRPCLFLLKLDDASEDTPDTLVELYSAEHGDSAHTARRPELLLDWTCDAADTSAHEVFLERGRGVTLRTVECRPGDGFAATFTPDGDAAAPRVEVREEVDGTTTAWREVRHPFRARGERVDVRLRAVRDPVELGEAFTATVHDTWVIAGPEETREVLWRFRAPSGAEHEVRAEFEGDYRWRIRFAPDEVGRWTYVWEHDFTPGRHVSPPGAFDVVVGDPATVLDAMRSLYDEVGALGDGQPGDRERLGRKLMGLQRAAMSHMSPEAWRASEGEEVRDLARRIRSGIWGQDVPDPLPREAHARPWKDEDGTRARERNRTEGGPLAAMERTVLRAVRALARRLRR